MTKVVYNACYGGFGLSHEAIMRYAEIKGITLYPEEDERFKSLGPIYWTVPPDQRISSMEGEAWHRASTEERIAYNEAYSKQTLYSRDIDRADPALVQTVEELGDKANGRCAKLAIEDVPAGSLYRIDEYDGNESVMTQGGYEWRLA